jgi:hypothetical protein
MPRIATLIQEAAVSVPTASIALVSLISPRLIRGLRAVELVVLRAFCWRKIRGGRGKRGRGIRIAWLCDVRESWMGGNELEGGAEKLILSKTVKKMCHEHPYAVGVHRLLHAQRTAGKVALQTILRDAVEQTHFLHDLMDTGFDRGMRVRRARLRDGPSLEVAEVAVESIVVLKWSGLP